MAEEEEDDGFGAFTFASFNPSTKAPPHIATATSTVDDDDDDEWGDFVRTPLGSFASSTTATPTHSFSVDPLHTSSEKPESGNSTGPQSSGWLKVKGAIPLSIFGEIEEEKEEEVEGSCGATADPRHADGKDSMINGSLGVPFNLNAITSLYNNNDKKNSSSVAASMHKRSESESGRISSSLNVQGMNGIANGSGISSNLSALDLDFNGWSTDFNANSNSNDHSLQSGDEIGDFQFSSNGISSGMEGASHSLYDWADLKPHVMESKLNSNRVHIVMNVNGSEFVTCSNEQVGGGDDDDEWEFKDADVEEVKDEVEQISGGNAVSKLANGTVMSTNLFNTSNGSIDMFPISSGFPSKTDWSDIGFGISNLTDCNFTGSTWSNGEKMGSIPISHSHGGEFAVESAESDEDFGEFADAYGGSGKKLEADSVGHQIPEINAISSRFNGINGTVDSSVDNRSFDLFLPANSKFSDPFEVSMGSDINPIANGNTGAVHGGYVYDTPLQSEQMEGQPLQDGDLIIQSAELDDDFGEFTEARAQNEPVGQGELKVGDLSLSELEIGKHNDTVQGELKVGDLSLSELEIAKHNDTVQKNEIKFDQRKGALPLSIFGDEEEEVDGSLNANGDFNMLQPASSKGNVRSPNSSTSINDLITNLYSQAEGISSSSLHTPVVNGFEQYDSGDVSSPAKYSDADDDDKWEFTDSFSHGVPHIDGPFPENKIAHEISSSNLKIQNYVDFYSKLKQELYIIIKVHLIRLKETESTAISHEDEIGSSLVAKIQEACKEISPANDITIEDDMGNHTSRDVNLNKFVEVLHEPKFQALQAEYNLEMKFLQVESDANSVLELIQHTKSMLKILLLGSLEDQSSYVSIWSKMIFACAKEMQHGSLIWRQALQNNIHSQILAEHQGKTFVLALGEMYRAAVLLGTTVKLYKPWILSSNVELSRLYSLLEQCHSSWRSSGLKEAFLSVLEAAPSEDLYSHPSLLDSIKYTCDLDDFTLQNHVFIKQEAICRLSLLTPRVMPGTSMITWDGEQCFLRLANLWVNLVSLDHPKLPPILVIG